ncbi:MAG: acetyl-CoA carboxylase carboxyltransferase subunit alpha [Planctomycetes bacterium]|nr:acetyl-CoA carboxylase carboxyltransferase subunit alpha [Planctomycetota bacterium]
MEYGSSIGLEFEGPIVELEAKIEELRSFSATADVDLSGQIEELQKKCDEKKRAIYARLTPWQKVQIARHPDRPLTTDYIKMIVADFLELHGDRSFRDDPAIITGLGRIGGQRCMIVGHRKGKTTREKIECNFGCANPEGYRKAMMKMRFAEKFKLPIVTFINTPGAYPGIGAEERGQAFVIARNLMEMAALRVPVISIVIGEGGSGGALGIGVADRLLMLEHSYYSVISPEGCAAILWKDAVHAPRAAEILKLTAQDLKGFEIIDEVIPEPLGGAHRDAAVTIRSVEETILRHLEEVAALAPEERVERRFSKYRAIGAYVERQEEAKSAP